MLAHAATQRNFRNLLAFSGAQFGRPAYHTAVEVAELKKWTFRDNSHATQKNQSPSDSRSVRAIV
jgi:hypothetical protein